MMQMTLNHATQELDYQQACETLPRITAWFAQGMEKIPNTFERQQRQDIRWSGYPKLIRLTENENAQTIGCEPFEDNAFIARFFTNATCSKSSREKKQRAVAGLIAGISRHFNNILMGIWGNIALIKLQVDQSQPVWDHLKRIDKLIQDGSYLLHLIIGCLGERRLDARRIRIKQLVNELDQHLPHTLAQTHIEASLRAGGGTQEPRLIAGSTARVFEMLLMGIETLQDTLILENLNQPRLLQRAGVISALLKKGKILTTQLLWYAQQDKPKKKRISITKLVHRQVDQLKRRFANITFIAQITPRLPPVVLAPVQIEWVVHEIMTNACNQMSSQGSLLISVKPMYAQKPGERCGVHGICDYLVIQIKDDGPGIILDQQKRIFEPFFTINPKNGSTGLGLAAADSILKTHGGFIQVQSKPGKGSRFKIYLPILSEFVT